MQKLLDELEKLNLAADSYVIFGSGPMVVRGLKKAGDLDIIVKKNVWDRLAIEHGVYDQQKGWIVIGDIDVFYDWEPLLHDVDLLFETAEMINGHPYVRLEHVLEWKKLFGREKDLKDVEIIKHFITDR